MRYMDATPKVWRSALIGYAQWVPILIITWVRLQV